MGTASVDTFGELRILWRAADEDTSGHLDRREYARLVDAIDPVDRSRLWSEVFCSYESPCTHSTAHEYDSLWDRHFALSSVDTRTGQLPCEEASLRGWHPSSMPTRRYGDVRGWRRQAAAHQHQDTLRQNSPHRATANLRRHPCRVDRSLVGTTQFFVPRALAGQIPSSRPLYLGGLSDGSTRDRDRCLLILVPRRAMDRAQQDVSVTWGLTDPRCSDSAVQVATAL